MNNLSLDEKFDRAVNIIQRLPKEGSFSPSNDLKLKFYSYYKQATEGPCTQSKPPFWDLVKRAKWDAWMKLGELSPQEAKKNYVDSLISIMRQVEISERSDNEEDLKEVVRVLGPFVEIVLPKYPFLSKVIANGTVPTSDKQPLLVDNNNDQEIEDLNRTEELKDGFSPAEGDNAYTLEEDFFSDTSDQIVFMECSSADPSLNDTKPTTSYDPAIHKPPQQQQQGGEGDMVDEHLAIAVIRLQNTLVEVQNRLDSIEKLLQKKKQGSMSSSRLPILELSTPALMLILGWPFLIHLLLHALLARGGRPPHK